MVSRSEMVDKGKSKMTDKAANMERNYNANKDTMIRNFKAVGFKSIRNDNYEDSVRKAVHRTDSAKWASKWEQAMFD